MSLLPIKLDTTEEQMLKALVKSHSLTKVGVLRQALRLLYTIDERQKQGQRLFFEDKDSKERIEFLFL